MTALPHTATRFGSESASSLAPTARLGDRVARTTPAVLPRRHAASARSRLPLALGRPGDQWDRVADHAVGTAVPGLRPHRLDARDRRAHPLPADSDPGLLAGSGLGRRRGGPAADAADDAARAHGLQREPRDPCTATERPVA